MQTISVPLTPAEITLTGKIGQKVKRLFPKGCERILLIHIPQVDKENFDLATARAGRYPCFPPYGPGLLSRNLRTAGYTTKLIDLNYEILFHVADRMFDYSLWEKVLDEVMESFQPSLVAVSCMFSATHGSMKMVTDYLKEHFPQIPIVAGGVHPSNNVRGVLQDVPSIDIVIAYEADKAFTTFVDFVNNKTTADRITQTALLEDGEFLYMERRAVPAEDEVNFSPDYDLLPIGDYGKRGEIGVYSWLRGTPPRSTILANRGCRARCTFCSVNSFNGNGVRSRDHKFVADEMQRQVEKYKVEHFMWLDDDLFRPDCVDLFSEITSRGLNVTWDASNGVIASATTPAVLRAARDSGCIGLSFGIESGDPEILRSVKKPSTVKHFRALGGMLKEHPTIFTKGFLMVGFPDETIEKIWNTINLALEMALDWYPIQILMPFGGTEMAKKLIERGVTDEHTVLSSKMQIGPAGAIRLKERREDAVSTFNPDVLDQSRADRIPAREELPDIWFLMDYMVNYRRINDESDPVRLRMKALNLQNILDRIPRHVALASLYLGVINQKLGNFEAASSNFEATERYLEESAFWRLRFEKLGLNEFLAKRRSNESSFAVL